MVTINEISASFQYNEQNLFQSIVDKTLYAVKYMAKSKEVDDNVLTYSLSHDEKEYVCNNIAVAINNIKKLVSDNTFYIAQSPESLTSADVGFAISLALKDQKAEINPDKTLILDSFSEMYIINYVLVQWAKLINIEKLADNFEVQTGHCIAEITTLLSEFTTLLETKSYEIT